VTTPVWLMRPILFPLASVNHTARSGPPVMPDGVDPGVGTGYSMMRLAALAWAPAPRSGLQQVGRGARPALGSWSSPPRRHCRRRLRALLHQLRGTAAVGWKRPILLPSNSVNHWFPSGPAVISWGKLFTVGIGYSVMAPPVVIRPTLLP
jgi:hypothetical protein